MKDAPNIRCLVRSKDVAHTPEEGVRQRLLHYFVAVLGYPSGLIAVEQKVQYNGMPKRADIIVHDRAGRPWMLVECKRPSEPLGQRTLAQMAMYDRGLQVRYLMLSNGDESHILEVDREQNTLTRLAQMPKYPILD